MEHSWILILAMIGHILCVYADRLLLCTPGGQFGFSDMKDNARMVKLFGAKPESEPLRSIVFGTVAIVGDSYGGFLAMQLLTWINRYNSAEEKEPVRMPELLIMNSPFAYPKTSEEWRLAEELEKIDVMLPVGAFRYMFGLTKRVAPETPDYALYPEDMDFHNAPETYVFYAEEACAAVADVIENSYTRDGSGGKYTCTGSPA